jgi:hypothetical protein
LESIFIDQATLNGTRDMRGMGSPSEPLVARAAQQHVK